MNVRTKNLLLDMGIAVALAVVLGVIGDILVSSAGVYLGVLVLPIIWIALRYGIPTGIVVGALTGLIYGLITHQFDNWIALFVGEVLGLTLVGLAGFFAKYTQKTLNNRRLSSTYLNIVTASLLGVLVYYTAKFWLVSLFTGQEGLLSFGNIQFWISLVLTWALISGILVLMARLKPDLIIPARSRFLSRKETSSLLND